MKEGCVINKDFLKTRFLDSHFSSFKVNAAVLESLKSFLGKKSWEGSDLGELWTAAAWAQDFISDPSSVHSSIPSPHANLWNLCLWLFLLSLPLFPCRVICRTLCIFSFRGSIEHYPWSVLPCHQLHPSPNVPLPPQLTHWDPGKGNHVFLAALLQFPFKRDVRWEKNRFGGSSVHSLLPWPPPCS